MMKQILTVFLILLAVNAKMDLVMFSDSNYPEALCVDGSHAGFYIEEGTGDGKDKFIVFLQSGGACFGPTKELALTSCYSRSFTDLGSSQNWSQTKNGAGILQTDETKNPHFHNWNKVFVPYCDGLVHQGHADEPYTVLGKKLYFRGLDNTMATFQYLIDHYGLASESINEVLLTGTSAGGIATFYYADVLKNMLPASTRYWAAADSGFFINYYVDSPNSFFVQCINSMLNLVDRAQILPQGCPDIHDDNAFECVSPQYWIQNIESDLYIIQSAYDQFTLTAFMGIICTSNSGNMEGCSKDNQELIQDFRIASVDDINQILYKKKNANAWVISCIHHAWIESNSSYNTNIYEVTQHSGNTPQQALYEWMYADTEQRTNLIDKVSWPLNQPCNGLNGSEFISIFE